MDHTIDDPTGFRLLAAFAPASTIVVATDDRNDAGDRSDPVTADTPIELTRIRTIAAAVINGTRALPGAVLLHHEDPPRVAMFEGWMLPSGIVGFAEFDPAAGTRIWTAHQAGAYEPEFGLLNQVTARLRSGWDWAPRQIAHPRGLGPSLPQRELLALDVMCAEALLTDLAGRSAADRIAYARAASSTRSEVGLLGRQWATAWARECLGDPYSRSDRFEAEVRLRESAPELMSRYYRRAAFEPAPVAMADAAVVALSAKGSTLDPARVVERRQRLAPGAPAPAGHAADRFPTLPPPPEVGVDLTGLLGLGGSRKLLTGDVGGPAASGRRRPGAAPGDQGAVRRRR